jgi:hypothetical protein
MRKLFARSIAPMLCTLAIASAFAAVARPSAPVPDESPRRTVIRLAVFPDEPPLDLIGPPAPVAGTAVLSNRLIP